MGTGIRLTYEDYLAIPPDGKRHEIVDGDEIVSPAPKPSHQDLVLWLGAELRAFCRPTRAEPAPKPRPGAKPRTNPAGGLGRVFISPLDVRLSPEDVVQPDVLFISARRLEIIQDWGVAGAPDLVIEVLSESNRRLDEVTKLRRYEKFGVQEYWVVDPALEAVKVYRRKGAAFAPAALLRAEDDAALVSKLLPGLRLGLRRLFAAGG